MRRQGHIAALEAAHARLARAKADATRERLEELRRTSGDPRPMPLWVWVAVAVIAYLVAWGVFS